MKQSKKATNLETKISHPKYSICICNYNMADTIRKSLLSILNQVDNDFEVLIIDDGSTDGSVKIINQLKKNYQNLRLISLKRSMFRQLGATRNISVKEAKGKYVILHIDSDDLWEPYIKSFVYLFHKLENAIKKDVLVSGNQINIAKRDFLLKHGPYRNTHRSQDRDMWHRFAALNRYVPVDHLSFRTRLPRNNSMKIKRIFRNTWFQLLYEFRTNSKTYELIKGCLISPFIKDKNFSFSFKIVRIFLIPPVFILSRFYKSLPFPSSMPKPSDFLNYKERERGTFPDLFNRYGSSFQISKMTKQEQIIFGNAKNY